MTKTHDTKATAAAMRKALRAAFPGHKLSVTMDRGTAYGWLNVSWTDGPREADVEVVASLFQSSRFSGMDDAYHTIEGAEEWSCRGITYSRRISPDALASVMWSETDPYVRKLREDYHYGDESVRYAVARRTGFVA